MFQQHFLRGCTHQQRTRQGSGTEPRGCDGRLGPSSYTQDLGSAVSPGVDLNLAPLCHS